MITLPLRAYNKNKRNLISRCDGEADLLTWCLNIHVDYSFLICHFTVMHARFTLRRPLIKISSKRGQNVQENTPSQVRATETLKHLY